MLVHYYTFRETCAALKKSSSGLKKMLAEGKKSLPTRERGLKSL